VNGLPIEGKAFLSPGPSGFKFNCDDRLADHDMLLDMVKTSLVGQGCLTEALLAKGGAAEIWSQLCNAAKGSPARRSDSAPRPSTSTSFPTRANEALSTHGLDISSITNITVPIHIKVDHREPPEMVELLRQGPKTFVEVCSLEIGDYLIDERVIVERKTVADFEASVIEDDKRLFTQSERIKHRPELLPVVLLEGDVFGRRQRMSVPQITGAITFLSMIQGMNVLTTLDMVHSAYFLIKLGAHAGENGLGYDVALRTKKPKAILSARRFVLEGIPGVSAALAEVLLEHFGTIAKLAAASEKDLLAVPGIGPQRAKQIREVLAG